MSLIGAYIHAKVATNDGRIDAFIETASHIFVFEIKLFSSAEKALAQIESKAYYQKFLHSKKTIVLVGVEFDHTKRTIHKWIARELKV